jgi:hypothetical protein
LCLALALLKNRTRELALAGEFTIFRRGKHKEEWKPLQLSIFNIAGLIRKHAILSATGKAPVRGKLAAEITQFWAVR